MCKETFTVCKSDVSHCCRGRLFPLTNMESSSHVDGSSSPQSMLDSIGQCASAINVLRQNLLILIELQLNGWMSIFSAFNALPSANAVMQACCDFEVRSDSVELFLFLTETGVTDRRDNRIIPRKIWRNIDATCGCRCCTLYNFIALTPVPAIDIFKRALNLRNTVREVRACFVLQSKRETVFIDVFRLLWPFVSNHVSRHK